MKYPHWYYFAALSEDVEKTCRYVEPSADNFKTYSIEFTRLYLAIGSEIDVVAKVLCRKSNSTNEVDGINSYRPIVLAQFPKFPCVEVIIPRSSLTLTPWKEWSTGTNPEWWKLYNLVKHRRDENFRDANLENTLNALAGLYVIVGYLYAEDLRDKHLPAAQDFLRFNPRYHSGNSMGAAGFLTGFRLPGVKHSEEQAKILRQLGRDPDKEL